MIGIRGGQSILTRLCVSGSSTFSGITIVSNRYTTDSNTTTTTKDSTTVSTPKRRRSPTTTKKVKDSDKEKKEKVEEESKKEENGGVFSSQIDRSKLKIETHVGVKDYYQHKIDSLQGSVNWLYSRLSEFKDLVSPGNKMTSNQVEQQQQQQHQRTIESSMNRILSNHTKDNKKQSSDDNVLKLIQQSIESELSSSYQKSFYKPTNVDSADIDRYLEVALNDMAMSTKNTRELLQRKLSQYRGTNVAGGKSLRLYKFIHLCNVLDTQVAETQSMIDSEARLTAGKAEQQKQIDDLLDSLELEYSQQNKRLESVVDETERTKLKKQVADLESTIEYVKYSLIRYIDSVEKLYDIDNATVTEQSGNDRELFNDVKRMFFYDSVYMHPRSISQYTSTINYLQAKLHVAQQQSKTNNNATADKDIQKFKHIINLLTTDLNNLKLNQVVDK
ncbi:hypothetical protein PPL_07711 [Heterostelium album PN500]|uniref:Uncharacterized protein n=1 Tax=Heterostelium pallidum (strain ATCC 26659 / Pp 5 / PN500) TaxID=670386 RepID=D3BGQ9_HETP5|nr:hypothetical protein PPL_07711 [Heterostelium album PN500]EFA79293.1 hypothetical protein PPL_07711 [Heterostelium album PN500]|eukprot:XP_020431414.1 hypothetical protein PPL_07711 [Heterostelium album PN500]